MGWYGCAHAWMNGLGPSAATGAAACIRCVAALWVPCMPCRLTADALQDSCRTAVYDCMAHWSTCNPRTNAHYARVPGPIRCQPYRGLKDSRGALHELCGPTAGALQIPAGSHGSRAYARTRAYAYASGAHPSSPALQHAFAV